MTRVIKRDARTQDFDPEKLELTCIRAALNSHFDDEKGKEIGRQVLRQIMEWLGDRQEVRSDEIFNKTIEVLESIDKDIAFMYKTHRDIS